MNIVQKILEAKDKLYYDNWRTECVDWIMLDAKVIHNVMTHVLYAKEMLKDIQCLSSVDILTAFSKLCSSVIIHSSSKYENFVLKYWECKLPKR